MYLEHWSLERSPFVPSSQQPLYYEGASQAEAAARLRFVVRTGRRLAVLVGEPGVGKTATLASFAQQCRREGRRTAVVNLAGMPARELAWQLGSQFALGPQPGEDAIDLLRRVAVMLEALRWQSDGALVLLDDADHSGPDARSQLVRQLNATAASSRLTLIVAAAPAGVARLGAELLERADLRIDLEPWDDAETIGYVQHALVEAGCERPAFDDEALAVLATLSGGVPRHVNRLADHALLLAAADGLDAANAATIEAAYDALNWVATAS